MGVIYRLILMFCLVGCASNYSCSSEHDGKIGAHQRVSFFASDSKAKSRNAAVEITSVDSEGSQIKGSGAYIKYKGSHYILTAAHVVSSAPVAMIENDGETIIGDVVFVDELNDVALVSIKGMVTRAPIMWSVEKDNKIGEQIIYSGYPNAYKLLTIEGKVAGYDGEKTIIHSYVWKGASGSVVLSKRGKIVGVVSAVDVGADVLGYPTIIEDVGLVVPVDTVEEFLQR